MSHLAPLIANLALILICAGIMTLLFKKLKQPLVLGYVVAGFLASPHMAYTPSVMDTANIQTWADIGLSLIHILDTENPAMKEPALQRWLVDWLKAAG